MLVHRASHDGLTGLLNQRAFRERLAAEAATGDPQSLIVVDLDHSCGTRSAGSAGRTDTIRARARSPTA